MMFHRVCFAVPAARSADLTDDIEARFSPSAVATGDLAEGPERAPAGMTPIELLFDAPPPLDRLRLLLAAHGIDPTLLLSVQPLPQRDWVRESLRSLAPVRAGRFRIAGSHTPRAAADSGVRLCIDAGLAFGTGHHETTCGCLMMIDRVLNERRPRRMLDVGTGTGVLTLAALKARPSIQATASDIDPAATLTARDNLQINGARARVFTAVGVRDRRIAQHASYDLITANILARPLIALAPQLTPLLLPGGDLILAGLLREQTRAVQAAYRAQGVFLHQEIRLGVWSILRLRRLPERVSRHGG